MTRGHIRMSSLYQHSLIHSAKSKGYTIIVTFACNVTQYNVQVCTPLTLLRRSVTSQSIRRVFSTTIKEMLYSITPLVCTSSAARRKL